MVPVTNKNTSYDDIDNNSNGEEITIESVIAELLRIAEAYVEDSDQTVPEDLPELIDSAEVGTAKLELCEENVSNNTSYETISTASMVSQIFNNNDANNNGLDSGTASVSSDESAATGVAVAIDDNKEKALQKESICTTEFAKIIFVLFAILLFLMGISTTIVQKIMGNFQGPPPEPYA